MISATNVARHGPVMGPAAAELTPNRRTFLAQAASTIVLATTVSATSPGIGDPIFAAIEAHRGAFAKVLAILDVHTALENELPGEKRRSYVDVEGEHLIGTDDDPRWIECERAVMRAWDAEGDAAIELVNLRPTTFAGVAALLQYAISADCDGETWPRSLLSDDETKTRSWHHFLIQNLAEILPGMVEMV
jgi:hypothetical protein